LLIDQEAGGFLPQSETEALGAFMDSLELLEQTFPGSSEPEKELREAINNARRIIAIALPFTSDPGRTSDGSTPDQPVQTQTTPRTIPRSTGY
tara:strand:- start:581 stop:859 length:279 start_codon:yes stop_codon:yes gene_type:complete